MTCALASQARSRSRSASVAVRRRMRNPRATLRRARGETPECLRRLLRCGDRTRLELLGRRARQHAADLPGGDRRAEEVALHLGAALAAHELDLLLGLDALGRSREAEGAPETADGTDHRQAAAARQRI